MSIQTGFQSLEIQSRHASDLVHWVEGSGIVTSHSRPLASNLSDQIEVSLLDAPLTMQAENILPEDRTPKDLYLTHKSGLMILWRLYAENDHQLINVHSKDQLNQAIIRPDELAYKVNATLSDQRNLINPREINLINVGNFIDIQDADAKGFEVKVYRSPMGTQLGSIGGLEGTIKWDTGEPASWAIISCEVDLIHSVGKQSYVAQADVNGDFRLAFSALPFPKKQGNSRPSYKCEVAIKALKSVSQQQWHQPDNFVEVEIKETDKDKFDDDIKIDFASGKIQRLTSEGSDSFLIIKEDD